MFSEIGIVLGQINIFGIGIYLAIIGLIFAIARGIGNQNKEQILMWSITLGMFATLLLFRDDYIKGVLFITTVIVIIIYGLNKLGRSP